MTSPCTNDDQCPRTPPSGCVWNSTCFTLKQSGRLRNAAAKLQDFIFSLVSATQQMATSNAVIIPASQKYQSRWLPPKKQIKFSSYIYKTSGGKFTPDHLSEPLVAILTPVQLSIQSLKCYVIYIYYIIFLIFAFYFLEKDKLFLNSLQKCQI